MQVIWKAKALKQVRKLNNQALSKRLFDAAFGLQNFPDVSNLKVLVNHEYTHRLRVGDYRLLITIDEDGDLLIGFIEEVKKRDERTY